MKQDPRAFRQAAKGALARLRRRQWVNAGTVAAAACAAALAVSGPLRHRWGPEEVVVGAVLVGVGLVVVLLRGAARARVERALGEKIDGWWHSPKGDLAFIAADGVFLEGDAELYPYRGRHFRVLSAEYDPRPHALRLRWAMTGSRGREVHRERALLLPTSVRPEDALGWAQLIEERAAGVRADAKPQREAPRAPVWTRTDDEDTLTDVSDRPAPRR